jgi:hypothetical protein
MGEARGRHRLPRARFSVKINTRGGPRGSGERASFVCCRLSASYDGCWTSRLAFCGKAYPMVPHRGCVRDRHRSVRYRRGVLVDYALAQKAALLKILRGGPASLAGMVALLTTIVAALK